jgi:hypothetical protein
MAKYVTTDADGKEVTLEHEVQYYSWSTSALKEQRARIEAKQRDKPDEPLWFTDSLVDRLHALPDLRDEKNKPFKISVESLDDLDVRNIEFIREAIENDLAPKAPPSK